MKRFALTLFILAALLPACASAQGDALYHVADAAGAHVFTYFGTLHEGDEYIAADNTLYRISLIDGSTATADHIGTEPMPDVSWLDAGAAQAVFSEAQATAAGNTSGSKKLIAMYVTHSDESYIPTDGTESINGKGGIYDVARQFRDALEAEGIDVILDESTHLPHDSGAYRRSRQTAERLLQKMPDAIIDIHRDGIPDESEYACTIEGEKASQIRLLVGRSNQNSAVNRAFAKQIKAVADKKYPGLIKDIFIGKGNYNQDLSPNAILFEFGTHTLSKERVLESTNLMADVVNTALYGTQTGSAKGEKEAAAADTKPSDEKKKGTAGGVAFLVIAAVAGIILFAFAQTGGGKAMKEKLGRGMSEMTGGLTGKKPKDKG